MAQAVGEAFSYRLAHVTVSMVTSSHPGMFCKAAS